MKQNYMSDGVIQLLHFKCAKSKSAEMVDIQ